MLVTAGFVWVLGASAYILFGLYAAMTAPTGRDEFLTAWAFVALLCMAAVWPFFVALAIWDAFRDDGRGEF
jgi:hypothetical protein